MNEALDWQAQRITGLEKRLSDFATIINSRVATLQGKEQALEAANAKLEERVEEVARALRYQHDERIALDERNKMLTARVEELEEAKP
jgi:hypothetical protein